MFVIQQRSPKRYLTRLGLSLRLDDAIVFHTREKARAWRQEKRPGLSCWVRELSECEPSIGQVGFPKGQKRTPETRRKMSKAQMRRYTNQRKEMENGG